MNAVEIEEAVSKLVDEGFCSAECPNAFLEAVGNKTATPQRLRNVGKNSTNKTDVTGDGALAVLQRNNIHMATLDIPSPLAPDEDTLIVREAHWPATIAELYDPADMPEDRRSAHDRNDETLERIYISRRFKNDTQRLETLFQLHTEMTEKRS